jgi:hypothetical protein
MASSDMSVLIDMGFAPERAELAVKKTGGCMSPQLPEFIWLLIV